MTVLLLCAACTATLEIPRAARQHAPVDPDRVKRVHLVQSNHLDVGFSDYVSNVMNRYLLGGWGTAQPPAPRSQPYYYESFLLGAANTSRILRRNASAAARYVYTQNSWVAYTFFHCEEEAARFPHVPAADRLRCPNATQREEIRVALARGDLTLHAFPHSAQAEVYDTATFDAGISLGPSLVDHLGLRGVVRNASVMQQRDVPGLTRAAVPLLARRGVTALSVGANDGSPAPLVPSTADCLGGYRQVRTPFVWRDVASGTSVLMDVHPGGYGGVLPVNPDQGVPYFARDGVLCDCVGHPALDDVLCYAWRGDNYGPAGVAETRQTFDIFGRAFPNATISAGSLDTFFDLLSTVEDQLPVVTSEIGDTWMYGVASDPRKTAAMRAMMRQRSSCVRSGACETEGGLATFTYYLLKLGEHTWGGSYAGHMNVTQPDHSWSNAEFERERSKSLSGAPGSDGFYRVAQQSWDEQRGFITAALAALDDASGGGKPASSVAKAGRTEASSLAKAIRGELAAITSPVPADPTPLGYRPVRQADWGSPLPLGGAHLAFEPATGAVVAFEDSGCEWASASRPLFRFLYQTHSYADKEHYAHTYRYAAFPHCSGPHLRAFDPRLPSQVRSRRRAPLLRRLL
jgi:hypothetical protein